MDERTCSDCSVDITSRHWRSKRCELCQRARELHAMNTKKPARYERACAVCGVAFMAAGRSTCCSPRCAGRASHPGSVDRDCAVCGQTFTISKQFERDTCSRPCMAWRERNPERVPARSCLWCGDELIGKALRARWCSQRCWHAMDLGIPWERIRDRTCVVCGDRIPRSVNYMRVVCSGLCRTRNRSTEVLFRQTHARRKHMDAARVHRVPKSYIRKLRTLPCFYCGQRGGTADHVVPISRGGKHAEGNLVPACRSCNSSKGNLLLIEWRIKRGGGIWSQAAKSAPRTQRAQSALCGTGPRVQAPRSSNGIRRATTAAAS